MNISYADRIVRMVFLKGIVLLLLVISMQELNAQDSANTFNYSFTLNNSFSHTGINSGLSINFRYRNHEVYLGPEMALSDSYFAENPRLGYNSASCTGNSFPWPPVFVFVNYQEIFYRPYLYKQYSSTKRNHISEIVAGMGQEWLLYKKWYLSGSMAYGRYFSLFHDLPESKITRFHGGTVLLRFSATYKWR